MAQKNNNDLLMEDELAAAFLDDDKLFSETAPEGLFNEEETPPEETKTPEADADWEDSDDDFPGQLAVDVYETPEKLVVKARTAGVDKRDLDVSISDGILTISGTLSSGDEDGATQFYIQECYWGEFTRTIALPVQVKEDEVEAVLKDGVLTVSFNKVKAQTPTKIQIN